MDFVRGRGPKGLRAHRFTFVSGNRSLARGLALAQIVLGMLVIAGWVFRIPVLTQVLAGMVSMVASTAVCFILQGTASLLMLQSSPRGLRVGAAVAVVELVLTLVNLAQIVFRVSLGINLPSLHSWIDNINPVPGQMSFAATAAFAIAAIVIILRRWRDREWLDEIAQVLIALVFSSGLFALLGHVLQLGLLYSWYPYTRMALHTSVGMLTVAVSLWLVWRDGLAQPSDERRIAAMGVAALIVVPLLTGLVGICVLKADGEEALGRSLTLAHQARVDALLTMLEQYSARSAIMTTRPNLTRQLRLYSDDGRNMAAREGAKLVVESFLPHGFSSIALTTLDGRRLIVAGTPVDNPALEVPLHLDTPGAASLLWQDGLVLRNRHRVRDTGGEFAEVVTEQPLIDLSGKLLSASAVGHSADLLLCGPSALGPACFPSRDGHSPFSLPLSDEGALLPVAMAFRGGVGSIAFHEADGTMGIAAYGPVGDTGLASAIRTDAADLYRPIGRSLFWGLLMVLVVTALSAMLLRGAIRLLTSRLAFAERRYQIVVESLQEGVALFDDTGKIIARNRAAKRLLRVAAEGAEGQPSSSRSVSVIREDGTAWLREDFPPKRTLRTGVPETDVVMGIRREGGRTNWISVNTALTAGLMPGQERGVVVSFADITERRQVETLARQLDQRFRLLVEGVADYGIFMLGIGGHIVSWNRGAERIVGYHSSEIVGRHFSVFYPRADMRHGKPADDLRSAAEEGRFQAEGWRVRKDGRRFWANVVITAVRDDQNKLIGFSEVTRDLTERRQAEQQLARAHQFQSAILESAPCSIIATDPSGVIRSMNPAAERMLGYAASELVDVATIDALHVIGELAERRGVLEAELGVPIHRSAEALLVKARYSTTEEREWHYVRKDGSRFPVSLSVSALRDENQVITGFLNIAYDITERRRRDEIVQHGAHHDFLTGLANRALLHDRLRVALDHARREQRQLAVLALDLDHLKRVNDSLGHHVGDQLLIGVAQRLLSCVRASDTVARMGGDEFVVLLGNVDDTGGVERVAQAIVERVSEPMSIGTHELTVTPSIGISRFPADGEDADTLLRNADSAMYLAKSAGRNRYQSFSRDIEFAARARLDLEIAIRRALHQNEFELDYQPQFCIATGEIVGVEALLRWDDPQRGRILPADFVPVAEENGLILPIGEWVLRRACRDGQRLRRQTGRPLKLAVNLSSRQFRHDKIIAMIQSALEESGLEPRALELEITEDVLMVHPSETLERLRRIRALGVSIAIGDFGAGLSSLSYVTALAIDTLKIDRVFIDRLPESASDAAMAQAIVALARSLGIRVVAEGVETPEQLTFLVSRSDDDATDKAVCTTPDLCEYTVQGYLFCKPVARDEFLSRFEETRETGRRLIADA